MARLQAMMAALVLAGVLKGAYGQLAPAVAPAPVT